MVEAHRHGVNPGGQVLCVPIPAEMPYSHFPRLKLMSPEEVRALDATCRTIREHKERFK